MKNCRIASRIIFLFSKFRRKRINKKKKKNLENQRSRRLYVFDVWRTMQRDEKWNQRADASGTSDVNCISGWHETIEFVICRWPRVNRFHVKSISQRGKFVVRVGNQSYLYFDFLFSTSEFIFTTDHLARSNLINVSFIIFDYYSFDNYYNYYNYLLRTNKNCMQF